MENTNVLWRYPLSNHSCCLSVNDDLWSWILRFISRRHTVLHFLHTTTAKSKAGHLIIRALFGMICSSEDIPFTRKFSWGALSASDNTDRILAGNDTATSPVTFTIHLRRWNMIVNVTTSWECCTSARQRCTDKNPLQYFSSMSLQVHFLSFCYCCLLINKANPPWLVTSKEHSIHRLDECHGNGQRIILFICQSDCCWSGSHYVWHWRQAPNGLGSGQRLRSILGSGQFWVSHWSWHGLRSLHCFGWPWLRWADVAHHSRLAHCYSAAAAGLACGLRDLSTILVCITWSEVRETAEQLCRVRQSATGCCWCCCTVCLGCCCLALWQEKATRVPLQRKAMKSAQGSTVQYSTTKTVHQPVVTHQ